MTHFRSAPYLAGLALLCAGAVLFATPLKVRAAADGQTPPTEEPPPKPDPGTTAQSSCLVEDDGYHRDGKRITFVVGLENKCESRLKCEVFAYHVSAKGPSSGHGTMILDAKSKGAGAHKTYVMQVKMASGSMQVARECRVI